MNPKDLKLAFNHYYETDLNNCLMTDKKWINELSEALTNPNEYLAEFKKEYKIYKNERQ